MRTKTANTQNRPLCYMLWEFNPMAFVENLRHMGVSMLVLFVVIGIIILASKLVKYLFSE